MEPISPKHITVTDPFWAPRIRTVTGTARRTEQKKERHCLQLQAVPLFVFIWIITSYPQCCLPALWGSAHPAR